MDLLSAVLYQPGTIFTAVTPVSLLVWPGGNNKYAVIYRDHSQQNHFSSAGRPFKPTCFQELGRSEASPRPGTL